MIQLIFSKEEINQLKYEKKKNTSPIIRKRAEALYLKAHKYSNEKIEEIVGICYRTLLSYLKNYQKEGFCWLKRLNYKSHKSKMYNFKEEIINSLEEKPVSTLKEAATKIKEITGLDRSIVQVRIFLRTCGIKRRKVKQITDKKNIID